MNNQLNLDDALDLLKEINESDIEKWETEWYNRALNNDNSPFRPRPMTIIDVINVKKTEDGFEAEVMVAEMSCTQKIKYSASGKSIYHIVDC